MSIYVNVEGDWKKIPDYASDGYPPRVYDRTDGKWYDAKYVHVHAQGAWRQIWPIPLITVTTIQVTASGGVWPATGSTTVTIENHEEVAPGAKAPAPLVGTVTVTSGSWTQTFPASQLTKTFTLPARNAGTYTVNATWSENQAVTGQANYTIAKANATVTVTPAEQTIRNGQTCTLTTAVRLGGATLGAGGSTQIRRQNTTNGTFQGWYDTKPYLGGSIARTVAPEVSIAWQSRIIDHPNVNEAVGGATTWVQQKTTGYTDVNAWYARTYSHSGTAVRKDGYDVYHNRFDSTWGRHYGVIWFPGLSGDKTCTGVELWWYPEHTFNSTPGQGRLSMGYHWLGTGIPGSINPADSRLQIGVHGHYLSRDVEFYFNASPWMTHLVNSYRDGGFGIILGHSDSQAFYGYGRLTRIRYHWERWA